MRSLPQILARRAVLLQRISRQRSQFGLLAEALRRPASVADKVLSLARRIRLQPMLAGGITLLFLLIFRKRLPIARLTLTAMALLRWWRYLQTAKPAAFRARRRPALPPRNPFQ